MPGMLDGQENQPRKPVQPSDVVIMVKIAINWSRVVYIHTGIVITSLAE